MLDFLLDLPVLLMALEYTVPPLVPFPYLSKGTGKGPSAKGTKAAEGAPRGRVVLQLDSGGGGNGGQGLVMALLESAYMGPSSLTAAQQTADLEVSSKNSPLDFCPPPPVFSPLSLPPHLFLSFFSQAFFFLFFFPLS